MQKLTPWSFLISQNLWGTAGIYGQISKSGFLPVNETVFYGKLPRIDDLPVIHFESRGTVDKNEGNVSFLSTGWSKIGVRGPESRQKPVGMSDFCLPSIPNSTRAASKVDKKLGEMFDFCLPPTPNSARAASKVDKNWEKCLIFVYRLLQIRPARPRK